ncbi:MAG: SRPBCC family protein [Candidatus Phosphoribacter baldrii]
MTDARNLVTVQRLIPAPAAAIFDLLADPSRHPQIDGSGTVIAPTSAGSRRLGLGDTFGMSMKLGVPYSTRNVVVEFEPDRLIAWQTLAAAPLDKVVTGRVWRYELEPVEGGTIVRETWDISREAPLSRPLVRRMMAASTRENMARTLERIASVVAEAGLGSV